MENIFYIIKNNFDDDDAKIVNAFIEKHSLRQ